MYWRDYLEDIAEKESVCTFQEIIAFCTGSEKVPPLGFMPKPSVEFNHNNNTRFPVAITCACVLRLPTVHCEYNLFKENMDFGIKHCKGFGMP